jgi:hypothetical protein
LTNFGPSTTFDESNCWLVIHIHYRLHYLELSIYAHTSTYNIVITHIHVISVTKGQKSLTRQQVLVECQVQRKCIPTLLSQVLFLPLVLVLHIHKHCYSTYKLYAVEQCLIFLSEQNKYFNYVHCFKFLTYPLDVSVEKYIFAVWKLTLFKQHLDFVSDLQGKLP